MYVQVLRENLLVDLMDYPAMVLVDYFLKLYIFERFTGDYLSLSRQSTALETRVSVKNVCSKDQNLTKFLRVWVADLTSITKNLTPAWKLSAIVTIADRFL